MHYAASHTATSPVPSDQWRMLAADGESQKLPKGLDAAWAAASGKVQGLVPRRRRLLARARRVVAMGHRFEPLTDEQLRETLLELREVFRLGRERPADLDRAFGVIREAASRRLGMRPYREQVAAALALECGYVAEQATGEGKTLAASMAATIAGWRGHGCHVITVNDYLARRDAEALVPLYLFSGLSVAHIEGEMGPDDRRRAYAADVTYCTNKEVAADFLRDRLVMGRQRSLTSALLNRIAGDSGDRSSAMVMRGLECAIVDEADSVLIDEAVTPLIISGDSPNPEQSQAYEQAADLAARLKPDEDYCVNHRWREVRLTPRGRHRLDDLCRGLGGVWTGQRRSGELVTQALTARELFLPGKQYIVRGGKIVIVDESTGRLMPDRTWRDGLHQAVEAKEELEVQPLKQTLARVSFQRLFRRYHKLAGMTGTAWEARAELWQTYRLLVVRIPTHRSCIRNQLADRLYATAEERWHAVVERVQCLHGNGVPVLVGTRSVQASEHLSGLLLAAGLEHRVLNAVRHAEEAEIVAEAGQAARITVATNMAGRGTDIRLGPGVADKGGLHVITTERHESPRIDRQLVGRAARQGDPGGAIAILSMEDELLQRYGTRWLKPITRTWARRCIAAGPMGHYLLSAAQRRAERTARRQRRSVLRADDWLDENLAFAAPQA